MTQVGSRIILLTFVALTACQSEGSLDAERTRRAEVNRYRPSPDMPIQVTYRIDDNRFLSLENYDRCYGDNYYNDMRLAIHQKVWTGKAINYRGRLVIDDPSGMNIVFATNSNTNCGDRGCTESFAYSTDGGRTFRWLDYMNYSFRPSEDSEKFTIAAADDGIYVFQKRVYGGDYTVSKYPLVSGIDLRRPYPAGVHGESFMASKRPDVLPSLQTPSGQDHYTCDASLRAPNLTAPQ